MFPWIWLFAPHLQLPFSGNVAQDYRPTTDWLFGSIQGDSGDGAIEKQVFEDVASYGKQLGLITEVLIDIAAQVAPQSIHNAESLERLKIIQTKVEAIKANTIRKTMDDIESMIKIVQAHGGPEADELSVRLNALLAKN